MIGFFINITGLFSGLPAPFGVGASLAGAMARERATRQAYEAQQRIAMPKIVEGLSHIPRVSRSR